MRILTKLLLGTAAVGAIYFAWNDANLKGVVGQYIENGDVLTLEARFTPEQIMSSYRHELLADSQHTFQEPSLKFAPYLLIEAKYTLPSKKTKEGIILWGMVDGEMVLNTETWEKTHGFRDSLLNDANRNDFKIMNALAKNGGILSREDLQKELHLEIETMEPWIESAKNKHLIIQKGNQLQLHFQDPKILVPPQTKIDQWLVTKPYNHAQRIPKQFSQKQIQKIAQAAFGSDFTIRTIKEVALPIYNINVLNPDGSVHSSFWNALNGQRLKPSSIDFAS